MVQKGFKGWVLPTPVYDSFNDRVDALLYGYLLYTFRPRPVWTCAGYSQSMGNSHTVYDNNAPVCHRNDSAPLYGYSYEQEVA